MNTNRTRSTLANACLSAALLVLTAGAAIRPTTPVNVSLNGLSANGLAFNGLSANGLSANGTNLNGLAVNGLAFNGANLNGLAMNGSNLNGLAMNGSDLNGLSINGALASRARPVGLDFVQLGRRPLKKTW